MNRSKKTPNIVKAIILCFVLILVGCTILGAIYPASDPNSKECPVAFIFLLLLYSPIISTKIFPLKIENRAAAILCKVCKVFWVLFCITGIVADYLIYMSSGSTQIALWIIIISSFIYLVQLAKRQKNGNHSTRSNRNSGILPAPPMQSPPPPPAPPRPKPNPPRYTLARIDAMDGHAFEHFTADLLRKLGYQKVQVTRGSGDQGVDVLAEKEGVKYAFQCKCYSSDLGNKPVQEVHAGKYIYQCHVGVVITNRYFTQGAKDAAKATGILLWDRDKLRSLIEAVS